MARNAYFKKHGFTLAEVLITLGIIGIVAALTLPQLTQKYRKQEIETKLAKFYSVMNQALKQSISENGEISFDTSEFTNNKNAEYVKKWFQINITKYIKTLKTEEYNGTYYKAVFNDGSTFNSYLRISSGGTDATALYIFYCVNSSHCEYGKFDGINSFLFVYKPNKQVIEPDITNSTHEAKMQSCSNTDASYRHACAALIQENGWKIPDDYPWKF